MGTRRLARLIGLGALAVLLVAIMPPPLPVLAASPHRFVAPLSSPDRFLGRQLRPAHGASKLGARASAFTWSDPTAATPPGALRLAPQLPRANPVISATWTALGANPVQNEISLCTQPPDLRQCGSYGNASGRITSLAVDPTNPKVVYAGSAGGGVWKTSDAGVTWSPLTDTQASLAIGALAIGIDVNGQETIYAGTGEDNASDSQVGQGVLVSLDRGASWTLTGQSTFAGHHIGSIAVDRANPQHAFVASDIGLYETGNTGSSWIANPSYRSAIFIPPGAPPSYQTPSGAVRQIVQDPSDPNRYWLSVGDGCRTEAGDLLTGTNNGNTWVNSTPTRLTQYSSRLAFGLGSAGVGAPVVGYVSAAGCYGNLVDLEKTVDGAASWSQLYAATEADPATNPPTPSGPPTVSRPGLTNYFNSGGTGGQGYYDNVIAVDPADPDHAIFGGITVLATANGGASFTDTGREYQLNQGMIHPDFHALAFWSHDHVYAGNDGGVYKTNNLGGTGEGGDWTNISAGLDTIQYYSGVALDSTQFLGGAQDNGSTGNFPGAHLGSLPTGAEYLDGDGTFTAISPSLNANQAHDVWASYPGLGIFKGSSNAPFSSFALAAPCSSTSDPACGEPVDFVAPFLLDASGGGQTLVAGTNKVYLSSLGGAPGTWVQVSSSLGNPSYPTSDRLETMAMTPTGVTGEILTGSRYGKVFRSNQAPGTPPSNGTWVDVTANLPPFPGYNAASGATAVEPNSWVTGIAINPTNSNEAWVVIGGLHVGHVWHSTDLNTVSPTWLKIDGASTTSFPDVSADSVAFDGSSLYVGTETGILVCSACNGAIPAPAWSVLGNLPNVKVNGLSFTQKNELVAWTHGRGAWVMNPTSPTLFVSPTTLNLSCIRGSASSPPQTLTVTNKGGATVHWTVSNNANPTIIATPSSGMLAAGASAPIGVSPTPCPSATGVYTASLAFGGDGGAPTVPVSLAVTYRGQYTAMPPARILDTRNNIGHNGALGPQQTLVVQVAGQGGVPGITDPTPPSAAVINVTATNTAVDAGGSFLTVYPSDAQLRPNASNLNWSPGQTVANLVEVPLAPDGTVTIYNAAGSVDVIFDVQGWVSTPGKGPVNPAIGLSNPLVPSRIMDTRDGTGGLRRPMGKGEVYTLQVGSGMNSNGQPSGVPLTASAVVLNLTATNATAPSDFLTAYPSDANRPNASNVNFVAGQTRANRAVVRLDPTGKINLYNADGLVNVVVDVGGWFTDGTNQTTGAQFTGVTPSRILDTRDFTGGYSGALTAGRTLSAIVAGRGGVPPMDSVQPPVAVVMNVTATNTSDESFFTVFPSDAQRPINSDLNWRALRTVPNLVVVKLSPDGRVNIFNPVGSVDVIADVVGWYS